MRSLESRYEPEVESSGRQSAVSAATLALPLAIAGTMVAFTLARKVGLAHFLKPHQYSIALASAWTVVLCLLAAVSASARALQVGGGLHFIVWVPAAALYTSALSSRQEIDSSPTGMVMLTVLVIIAIAQLMGCGTAMSNLVMVIGTLAAFGAGLKFRGRPGLLLLTWVGLGWSCWLGESGDESSASMLTVAWEVTALLVVKIATPLLDEHLTQQDSGADMEMPSRTATPKWTW